MASREGRSPAQADIVGSYARLSVQLQHRVKLYLPPRRITAVVLLLHQYAATPEKVEYDSQLVPYAARYGWLLAESVGRGAAWNSCLCCGKARDANVPDTAFLATLIRTLRSVYVLDTTVPTIMGGLSNGRHGDGAALLQVPGPAGRCLPRRWQPAGPQLLRAGVPRLLMTRGVKDPAVPIRGMTFSSYLHTRLLPDQVLLDAFRRGSICHPTSQFQRQAISSRTERCGERVMRVVHDQAAHDRDNRYRPGIMNRMALSVEFILGVVRDKVAGSL